MESFILKMEAVLHHLQHVPESHEVLSLRGQKRMAFKERNDGLEEILSPLHREAHQSLSMIVTAAVLDDRSTLEELRKELQSGA
jgi:hypothetical protein